MKVWDITIDSDESGFTMRIRAECEDDSKCEFHFNIHDVAEDLFKAVKMEIGPWIHEMEEAKAAHARRDPRWMPREVQQAEAQDLLDAGVYDDDPAKRAWAQDVADGSSG